MYAVPTKILLVGQNDTMLNNVQRIIPNTYAISKCYATVEAVSNEVSDYQPDIAILCLDIDVSMDIEAYGELSSLGLFENISVIVLGQVEECYTFESNVFIKGVRIIQRPIKGCTLAAVLKKCEEEREISGSAKDTTASANGAVPAVRGEKQARYRDNSGNNDRDHSEHSYSDRNLSEREQEYRKRPSADDYRTEQPELEREIIKVPVGGSGGQKLHCDDILRIPPEKGRYFRNIVKEKQVRRVQTVFEEDTEEVVEPRKPTHVSGKFSVLVIDDDVQLLGAVRKYLQNTYFVTTVPCGKMAYKFLEVDVVDVILLDYLMRDEDGPSVFKTLRRNPRTADIPVIFLTGVSDKERVMNVLSLQPQGYLLKPIQKQELLTAIEQALEQET